MEILREAIPGAVRIGLLINSKNPFLAQTEARFRGTAHKLGMTIVPVQVASASEIGEALSGPRALRLDALVVVNDALLLANHRVIIDAVERRRLPTLYPNDSYIAAGGLMSYAYVHQELVENAAAFVDRVLRGANPAELPFEQPKRVELQVNPRTAKSLGIVFPASVLARATQVD